MNTQVRILHCHSTFSLGGKEARAVQLINAFGGNARHTILSAMPDQLGARDAIDRGIDVAFPDARDAPPLHGRPGPRRYRALARFFQDFDLVLTYNWGSMDAVMARRMLAPAMRLPPLVHHEDGFNADEADRLKWQRNTFRRLALPTARAVVVPSHNLERIARISWGAALPVTRISNGIDVARYRRLIPVAGAITGPVARPGAGLPGFVRRDGDVIVGTIAGLRSVKDLPLLVEAVAQTPANVRLIIVGDGPDRARIAAAARDRGIADRVLMPGFVADPASIIGQFDIMALSSLSEQQPIAVMEGMAAALPIVAPPVGDIISMVSDQNAPFIVPRSAAALATAIMTLATDAPLRAAIGLANRDKAADQFDQYGMIAAYARLYADAIDVPSNRLWTS